MKNFKILITALLGVALVLFVSIIMTKTRNEVDSFIAHMDNYLGIETEQTVPDEGYYFSNQLSVLDLNMLPKDGKDVSGDAILQIVKSFGPEKGLRVQVVNLADKSHYYILGSSFSPEDPNVVSYKNATTKGNDGYINPLGKYTTERVYDGEVLTELIFTQKK